MLSVQRAQRPAAAIARSSTKNTLIAPGVLLLLLVLSGVRTARVGRDNVEATLPKVCGKRGRLVEGFLSEQRTGLVGFSGSGIRRATRAQELRRLDEVVERERPVSVAD